MPPSDTQKQKAVDEYTHQLQTARSQFEAHVNSETCDLINIKECRLEKPLGKGGFGAVYRVTHGTNTWAVKVMKKEKYKEKPHKPIREKNFLCAMKESPFVTKIGGTFRDAPNLYLFLELADCGDLYDYWYDCILQEGNMNEQNTRILIGQIVCGLEYIHACGVFYRDMKPENCMLFERGRLKIGDFGLACKSTDRCVGCCGTYEYMAPEMFEGKAYDDAVDWWAVGVCMYGFLTGDRPFDKNDRTQTRDTMQAKLTACFEGLEKAHCSDEAKDLIKKLLEMDSTKRIGTTRPGSNRIKEQSWFAELGTVPFYDVIFGKSLISTMIPYESDEESGEGSGSGSGEDDVPKFTPDMFEKLAEEPAGDKDKWGKF